MTRSEVTFYLNGQRQKVVGQECFLTLSDFLRYKRQLTGTKVVCAEGDCGACTVMVDTSVRRNSKAPQFRSVNSCIAMVGLLDGTHVVTVEGLQTGDAPSEIQSAMIRNFGAQCGFCTPGFVMALTDLYEQKDVVSERNVKNFLTGNLCRCTGYKPIIEAGLDVDTKKHTRLSMRYLEHQDDADFKNQLQTSLEIQTTDGFRFFAPKTVDDATQILKTNSNCKIISGATDLGVQVNKGKTKITCALSLQNIPELHVTEIQGTQVKIGARATLSELQTLLEKKIPSFGDFMNIFASPQIKNVATLAGNVANASPIADTTPLLLALDALVGINGVYGQREVPLDQFFLDYKKTDLKAGEFITHFRFDLKNEAHSFFKAYKVSQRRDLDISCVNAALRVQHDGKSIIEARIGLGGVAATTVRLKKLEAQIKGMKLSDFFAFDFEPEILKLIKPISDLRGTDTFRKVSTCGLIKKFQFEFQNEWENH
jgi:xanthine dehydrogenase small subunit